MNRFRSPLTILALGLLPTWLFIGSTSKTTIAGEVISDQSFDNAGLVMGLIVVAGVVCLLQVDASAGVFSLPV